MKKEYMKPRVEVEIYELDAAIAANCGQVISLGPEAPGKVVCEEFKGAFDGFSLRPDLSIASTGGTPFYSDGSANCDCYYTSGTDNYFTS